MIQCCIRDIYIRDVYGQSDDSTMSTAHGVHVRQDPSRLGKFGVFEEWMIITEAIGSDDYAMHFCISRHMRG